MEDGQDDHGAPDVDAPRGAAHAGKAERDNAHPEPYLARQGCGVAAVAVHDVLEQGVGAVIDAAIVIVLAEIVYIGNAVHTAPAALFADAVAEGRTAQRQPAEELLDSFAVGQQRTLTVHWNPRHHLDHAPLSTVLPLAALPVHPVIYV